MTVAAARAYVGIAPGACNRSGDDETDKHHGGEYGVSVREGVGKTVRIGSWIGSLFMRVDEGV
eukprot:CAMPEP_0172321910 /NCGR_PEP_ID=MMETSP1058-20130122/44638_1 /TAXON_ID=83371 /ORGANISM="Detonula confervacea, Strain CCMP 353" /LENGTH=62 /DNA_ID=CAMNT_0013037529 /DNA_START=78 /DNA_END=263 /DNA_ORIENTATION=-